MNRLSLGKGKDRQTSSNGVEHGKSGTVQRSDVHSLCPAWSLTCDYRFLGGTWGALMCDDRSEKCKPESSLTRTQHHSLSIGVLVSSQAAKVLEVVEMLVETFQRSQNNFNKKSIKDSTVDVDKVRPAMHVTPVTNYL